MHQEFHRQQQRGGRPSGDKDRLPFQSRCRRDVRRRRDRDPQQESRPHRAPCPACVECRGLQQAGRGQEQEPVNGRRPQRSTDRIGTALQRELPLMNVRGMGRDSGHDESTQRPDTRPGRSPGSRQPSPEARYQHSSSPPSGTPPQCTTRAHFLGNSQVEGGRSHTQERAPPGL